MTTVDPFGAMRVHIEKMKSSIEQFLANGMAKDYPEYTRMVGEYAALMKVEGELNELEQRYIES